MGSCRQPELHNRSQSATAAGRRKCVSWPISAVTLECPGFKEWHPPSLYVVLFAFIALSVKFGLPQAQGNLVATQHLGAGQVSLVKPPA